MGEIDGLLTEDTPAAAWAEMPAYPGVVPAVIEVQVTPLPGRLREDADAYLDAHPEIKETIQDSRYDAVAWRRDLIIGVGIVALGLTGAIVLWSHGKRKK